ncbi:hypothetical protein O0L34_g4205 [Tuta absoluta]|nr:hypothetical protein O0L34_g4205 [Tuta absoluta]
MPCISKDIGSEWNTVWDAFLEKDLTPSTYYSLKNISLGPNLDYKFDYNAMKTLYRRYTVHMDSRPEGETYDKNYRQELPDRFVMFICRSQNALYQAAVRDVRKYFPLRILYLDNLEFEVGYLVYQVVHRYQMMVELYELAHRKFYLHEWQMKAEPKYMFYIYRNMLKLSNVIIHMCNMAHLMEKKYEGHESIFTHTDPSDKASKGSKKKTKTTARGNQNGGELDAALQFNKHFEHMEKQKKKALKKERQRHEIAGMTIYTPKGEPKRPERYPYIYGWSIEDWWL